MAVISSIDSPQVQPDQRPEFIGCGGQDNVLRAVAHVLRLCYCDLIARINRCFKRPARQPDREYIAGRLAEQAQTLRFFQYRSRSTIFLVLPLITHGHGKRKMPLPNRRHAFQQYAFRTHAIP
ncbi:MAG: hypothetical protein GY820_39790 [Gammaproteobacteria bacterium]|nr:hypothetical protein [Gammaproteobacteria bacterium]